MSQINFAALTLNPEEARSTSEVVFEQLYAAPEIANVHDVQTGVDMDRFIPLLGQYGLLGKIDPGGCSVNSEEGVIPVSQKKWQPKLVSFRLEHCQANVPDLLKFWKKSRIAAGTWEDVDNEMLAFIADRAIDATKQAILRHADFGNVNASPVGDGAGDETLTVGTDKGYFNVINGMWQQVFNDQAGAALIYRHTIAENALATKVAQLALGATAALDAMRAMYDNIDPRAFEGRNLTFQITRTLFNNWVALLEDKSLANAVFQKVEEGSTQWSYRGIPIIVRTDWDRNIRAYHDLGLTYYIPNRAILADLPNIPIGTSDTESFSEFRSFYDYKDKKHYMDVAYKIDMKILEEYAVAVAY
jgi:hypothetical protein